MKRKYVFINMGNSKDRLVFQSISDILDYINMEWWNTGLDRVPEPPVKTLGEAIIEFFLGGYFYVDSSS